MNNKKGFTLIELLATIIVLAIIILIAVPVINNVLKDVEKASFKEETQSILRALAVEREDNPNISMSKIDKYKIENNSIYYENDIINLDISMSSNLTGNGYIVYDENGDSNIEYTNGKFCASKSFKDQTITISDGDCSEIDSLICFSPIIKIVPSHTKFSQSKIVEILFDNSNNCVNSYIINNENNEKQYTNKFEVFENTKITAITRNKNSEYGEEKEIVNINTIDNTPPEYVSFSTRDITTKSIEIIVTAKDSQSGIAMYAFSKDGGATWTPWQKSKIYRFEDLETNDYDIVVKAYNGTYGSDGAKDEYGVSTSDEASVGLKKCPTPTYQIYPSTGKWHSFKMVYIDYGKEKGCIGSYSLDDGDNWEEKEFVYIDKNNSNIVARNTDGINTVTASTIKITGIDNTPPILSFSTTKTTKSITIEANASDPESGIYGYAFSEDGGLTWTPWQSDNKYTFDGLKTGTYEIVVKVFNGTYGSAVASELLGATVSPISRITLDSCPIPTYDVTPKTLSQEKTIKINYHSMPGCSGSYSLDGGLTWQSGSTFKVITNGQDIVGKNTDGTNTSFGSTYKVILDRTPPESVTFSTSQTVKKITVTASASDSQSGIGAYSFSKDGGSTWTQWQTSNVYTFTGLTAKTSYDIIVKVYNGTYGIEGSLESLGVKISDPKPIKTNACPTPTFSVNPSGDVWRQSKIVTITYPSSEECTVKKYSYTQELNWNTATNNSVPITFIANTNKIIAYYGTTESDGTTSPTYAVTKIDRTPPESVTFSTSQTVKKITVTASASDSQSGIGAYSFSKDGGSTWTQWQTSNVYTFTGLTANTSYNIRVRAYNGTYGTNGAVETLGARTSDPKPIKTNACPTPTFSVNPSGDVWASKKIVTITYPTSNECTVKKYSYKQTVSWNTATNNSVPITFTFNSNNIIAYYGTTENDGTTSPTYTVTKIDSTLPTAGMSIIYNGSTIANEDEIAGASTINATCSTGGSGVKNYIISIYDGTSLSKLDTITKSSTSTSIEQEFDPAEYSTTDNKYKIEVSCTNGVNVQSATKSQYVNYLEEPICYDSPTSCPCNGTSLYGTITRVCENSKGTIISETPVYECSGCCGSGCGGTSSGGSPGSSITPSTPDTDDDSGSSSGTTCKETCTTNAGCERGCTGMEGVYITPESIQGCVNSCPKTCTTTCS